MTRSALLVIDAQKIYTQDGLSLYCEDADITLQNINKLITKFQKQDQPIVYIKHQHKKNGSDTGRMFDFAGEAEDFDFKEGSTEVEFSDGLTVDPKAKVIVKNRYSSFIGTDLEKYLREQKIDRVVVCGFMTNFCCESAARDAHDRDFYVDFIMDATGTPGIEDMDQGEVKEVVTALLSAGFATIHETDDYLS